MQEILILLIFLAAVAYLVRMFWRQAKEMRTRGPFGFEWFQAEASLGRIQRKVGFATWKFLRRSGLASV